ncbi:Protein phosphatase 2C 6 [Diaporthe australafricana]|uniref:Protein phosphatase 2C 6 n=1 Tax=Diaporthe australafricana TaxID=127596 RepID=A0ABR3W087_9PEZI
MARPMSSLVPRARLSAGKPEDTAALLEEFMGFVATFFHDASPAASRTAHTSARGRTPSRRWFHDQRQLAMDRTTPASSPSHNNLQQQTPQAQSNRARGFHNYFVTHLPSSSLHPDSRVVSGPHHKLPRAASTPHTPGPGSTTPASPPNMLSRDLTVVRIPLRSAKHHFGAFSGRGSRPYNEDTDQAGTIDIPAFAKRAPMSLVRSERRNNAGEATTADSSFGDPQIFYFGVFDGHGGSQCAEFLRDELHGYVEEAANAFELKSSLRKRSKATKGASDNAGSPEPLTPADESKEEALEGIDIKSADEVKAQMKETAAADGKMPTAVGKEPLTVTTDLPKAIRLEQKLLDEYKRTIGGYFKRFRPALFDPGNSSAITTTEPKAKPARPKISIESILTYAFLRADLDFVTAQARKPDPDDPYVSDNQPLNQDEVLGSSPHSAPSGHKIGGPTRFKGGSTASIALISTPTPAPYWHPATHSTVVVAHVGDTRILLCETATGLAVPLTSDHHPSSPTESRRLARFAESVTDSFGEERIGGLANSRSFGDMQSKRVGVSAEPELTRLDLGPAQYSFLVLMSDGVSGTLSDQEIVDVIKEAKTPEQGAKSVVEYANEVSHNGDNATCLVVRLGGWERRSEGGLGSLGTKEMRDARRAEALDPRRGRR